MRLEQSDKYRLEKLFEDYHTAVLLYCISIVQDREEAKDIVQRAFISLWEKADSIDFHTSARAYLYKSVYHASLDWLKHKKIRQRYADEAKKSNPKTHAINNEAKELSGKLESAINSLPDQCRRVFKMNRYDQLRYKDIAAILQISEKTVEKHMVKALQILRERLKDYL